MKIQSMAEPQESSNCLLPSHLLPTAVTTDLSLVENLPIISDNETTIEKDADMQSSSEDDESSSPMSIEEIEAEVRYNDNVNSNEHNENNNDSDEDTLVEDNTVNVSDIEEGDEEEEEEEEEEDDDDSLSSADERERNSIDAATDCDGFKMNIFLSQKSYDQAFHNLCRDDDLPSNTNSIKRDVMIAKRMVEVFVKGGFQKTFGAASRVFVPKANVNLHDMIDRFSVKKGNYKVNKQVPQEVVGQEILVCIGTIEIAMWSKSVDIPMDQQLIDEVAGYRLTPVKLVQALKYLGYSGAELNPKCAATRKALKHDCLKYSHITLEKMLVAIFATRPRYLSIAGKFGARVDINTPDGAYENFWMWKNYKPPEFYIEKHLVRLDLAYNIPLRRKHLMQVTATIDNQVTEGVVQNEIFTAEAIGAGNARCSRVFYNGHTAAKDQRAGGVTLQFDKFNRPYSPSQVAKVKIYNTIAHQVRQKQDIVDGNRNIKDQLANMTVRKMQTGVLNLQETFHKGVDYLNEYGKNLRVETTIVS